MPNKPSRVIHPSTCFLAGFSEVPMANSTDHFAFMNTTWAIMLTAVGGKVSPASIRCLFGNFLPD